jgi:energy-coupling factor transporter ATP-binding protein EcfA2
MHDVERALAGPAPERAADLDTDYAGLRLSANAEGGYDTEFQLDLSGIRGRRPEAQGKEDQEAQAWVLNGLRSLFGTMAQGQEIVLGYHWSPELNDERPFDWSVVGRSANRGRTRSMQGAGDLRRSLETILDVAGFELYRSEPRLCDRDASLTWRSELAPRGIVIPCAPDRSVGFSSQKWVDDRVILATPGTLGGGVVESFTRASKLGKRDVALSVRITPVELSERAVDVLRRAHANLCNGPMGQLRFEGQEKGHLLDESLVGALIQRLALWIAEPTGYRVRCCVNASSALPDALMQLIGSSAWGSPVWIGKHSTDRLIANASGGFVVRLNQYIHRSEGSPNLLPSANAAMEFGVPRAYAASAAGFAKEGLLLGTSGPSGSAKAVRIAEPDRSCHCYIIGATGAGKSTLLQQMAVQDIERGAGLCLIDPHGDLFDQVLHALPPGREKDVILMDLTDFDHSVGLNFLECGGPTRSLQMNFITNELLTIFKRLYNMDIAGGPVFETYMRNALLTVMDNDERTATLMDVVRFFEDPRFRRSMIQGCNNAIAASFWNRQALRASGENSFENVGPYITSKLNQFTHNALLRPIIGQTRTTINFRQAMDTGQIILINLAKGLLGDFDMRLLGMLLIGKIVNAAMGRVTLPQKDRRRFYLYVDEFQTLATPTVIGLLSEARKFGLSLIMANQHLAQLTDGEHARGIAEAILGNVATMLFFRVGIKDAAVFEAYTRPELDAHELAHLPDRHVVCRMLRDNVPVDPFVMATSPLREPKIAASEGEAMVLRVRQRVRQTYARPRIQVDEEIMRGWVSGDRTSGSEILTS